MAELTHAIARIRAAAQGQREFASRTEGAVRAKLEETAITLDMAADIAEGCDDPLYVLVPQEAWPSGMTGRLLTRETKC